LIKFG